MSTDVESTVVRISQNNRRILVRRGFIVALILVGAACAYSFFLVFRFHTTIAAFQKHNANLMLAYKNDRGETVYGNYGAIPGPVFIPAPILRYHRSVTWMELRRQLDSTPDEIDELFYLLPQLSKLDELQLQSFLITQERAASIARLSELKYLTLKGCQIEKSALASLLQKNQLTHISLADSEFQEQDLETLSTETLTELILSNCKITNRSAIVLSRCRNLELLHLDGTQITDQGLKVLARLPNLKVLILDHTNVTDAGVSYLSSTPKLVELSLSNTSASDAMLETLEQEIPALRVSDD